jgi:plastocyanin
VETELKNYSFFEALIPSDERWNFAAFIPLCMGLLLLLLPCLTQAEVGLSTGTGTLHGKVRITKRLISERMRFRLYQSVDPQPPPAIEEERNDEWRNIVIYLESEASMPSLQEGHQANPQITQLGETFFPHVLPVVKGSTVEFLNEDPIFHNVFSLSRTKSFDLGRYPKGVSKSVTFDKTGVVPVFCHLHSDMSAIIMVLNNPYFSVPDSEGQYLIEGIPPGSYTIVAWHERSERTDLQIEIRAGEDVELNITVPITDEETSEQ